MATESHQPEIPVATATQHGEVPPSHRDCSNRCASRLAGQTGYRPTASFPAPTRLARKPTPVLRADHSVPATHARAIPTASSQRKDKRQRGDSTCDPLVPFSGWMPAHIDEDD